MKQNQTMDGSINQILEESFKEIVSIEIKLDSNPEYEDKYLIFELKLMGESKAIAEDYDIFISKVVETFRPEVSSLLRLSFDIVG